MPIRPYLREMSKTPALTSDSNDSGYLALAQAPIPLIVAWLSGVEKWYEAFG